VLSGVPSPKTVVLETGRSSYYMASLLDAIAEQVWIVDAREVRRLQRTISKTDRRVPDPEGGAAKSGMELRTDSGIALAGERMDVRRPSHGPALGAPAPSPLRAPVIGSLLRLGATRHARLVRAFDYLSACSSDTRCVPCTSLRRMLNFAAIPY
jgi:hypothetical protein